VVAWCDRWTRRAGGADRLDADEQFVAVLDDRGDANARQSQKRVVELVTLTRARGLSFSELSSNHENGEAICRVGGSLSGRGQVITHPGSLRRAAEASGSLGVLPGVASRERRGRR
jgi:hypothetical protein